MQVIDMGDPNFDPTLSMVQEESPYAEVRSAVANTDDPTMPASTLRAWLVGLVWAILLPGVNQFFAFRDPSVCVAVVCPPWHLSWSCLFRFCVKSVRYFSFPQLALFVLFFFLLAYAACQRH